MNCKYYLLPLVITALLSMNGFNVQAFDRQDTLRGSNGRGRNWWNVLHYKLDVSLNPTDKSISGSNTISFSIIGTPNDSMQIDLQDSLQITNMILEAIGEHVPDQEPMKVKCVKEGNVWWLIYPFSILDKSKIYKLTVLYNGHPRKAVNPPWDGGISWAKDSLGKPWIAVSCQGLGASVWWPCKDAQWDEPDSGMKISIHLKEEALKNLKAVSNGRLVGLTKPKENEAINSPEMVWEWDVKNPINTYDATFYIGDYISWQDTLMGENGKLDLDYWVLSYNEARARKQFSVVKNMLHCFEYWMGPYPFYEDGYKLVEAPYLGMEHQSAVAYGNKYQMGYLGRDRSNTGVGQKFDFIVVHESGHEWFGNNVTAADIADNWVHEGITTYSESLFAEWILDKQQGQQYCRGQWRDIRNDKPLIGPYGVNEEGSGDIYDKGSGVMHMIRTLTNDDERFRKMLRGLGRDFYHMQVTTKQVEEYIATNTGLDLKSFFNQYLRTTQIPKLDYYIKDNILHYRFTNIVDGFTLPVSIAGSKAKALLQPTAEWQQIKWKGGYNVQFTNDFLMTTAQ